MHSSVFYHLDNTQSNNNKKSRTINKVVNLDFYINNELTNQQIIKKYENYEIHFYLSNNKSNIDFIEVEDNFKRINNKKIDSILLEFDDRELKYFKNYLLNLKSSKNHISTIIGFFKQLLNSIRILSDMNIVHNHINFDNIVIDKYDNPLLSNFTFSIDTSLSNIDEHIKHFVKSYEPSYIEWPIELHLFSYLQTNKQQSLSSYNIELVINEYITHNNILNTFGKDFVSSYKIEALNYFKKYVNQNYNYILFDLLQYSNTWDNYALSILYLRILIGIHKTIQIKNKFIIHFMKLLVCNIHLNPLKRLSINNTLKEFDNMLEQISTRDYYQLIEYLD